MIRWQRNLTRGVLALSLVVGLGGPALAKSGPSEKHDKLDKILKSRAGKGGTSRVIITLKSGADPSSDVRKLGGRLGRKLGLINGQVVELPNAVMRKLAALSFVESVHYDRPTGGEMNRVAVATGARAVQATYGYTGAGVGVAVIDSGVTTWHDDLTYPGLRRPSASRTGSASPRSSTSSTAGRRRTTTTATGRTSPASSPATATTRSAFAPASRRRRTS